MVMNSLADESGRDVTHECTHGNRSDGQQPRKPKKATSKVLVAFAPDPASRHKPASHFARYMRHNATRSTAAIPEKLAGNQGWGALGEFVSNLRAWDWGWLSRFTAPHPHPSPRNGARGAKGYEHGLNHEANQAKLAIARCNRRLVKTGPWSRQDG